MGRFRGRRVARLLAALMGPLVAAGTVEASPYKVTEFFNGGSYLGLNDRGQVYGARRDYSSGRSPLPFVFDSLGGGSYTVLDLPAAAGSVSGSSQDVFLIPGAAGLGSQDRLAAHNVQTGRSAIVDVPAPYSMYINARDDSGRFYGNASDYESGAFRKQPFVSENGSARELGPPPGMSHALIVGVNARGDVLVQAGTVADPGNEPEAYLQRGGVWTHLGTFRPTGLNDKGDVIGYTPPNGSDLAGVSPILVPADGSGPVVLGGLAGASASTVRAINDRGEIVGTAWIDAGMGQTHAFIDRNGVVTDLNELIDRAGHYGELTVKSVTAINNLGQVLASGTDAGSSVYLLLSPADLDVAEGAFSTPYPVPEPSTLLIFAGLALGVGIVRRGRRA